MQTSPYQAIRPSVCHHTVVKKSYGKEQETNKPEPMSIFFTVFTRRFQSSKLNNMHFLIYIYIYFFFQCTLSRFHWYRIILGWNSGICVTFRRALQRQRIGTFHCIREFIISYLSILPDSSKVYDIQSRGPKSFDTWPSSIGCTIEYWTSPRWKPFT